MSSIDSYGEMDLPEEKSVIEVVEDPFKTVVSCCELYSELIEKNRTTHVDDAYQIAANVLKGKEKLKLDSVIRKIIDFLEKDKEMGYANVFLSALHNETDLSTLILCGDRFRGKLWEEHKLKADKKLVISAGSEAFVPNVFEGTVINYGKILNRNRFSGGIIIDFYAGPGSMNNCPNKGVLIAIKKPNGKVSDINVDVMLEKVPETFENTPREGKWYEFYSECVYLHKQKLEEKLKEIDFLNNLLQLPYEKQLEKVNNFDFKKFEKEITEIAQEMQKERKASVNRKLDLNVYC